METIYRIFFDLGIGGAPAPASSLLHSLPSPPLTGDAISISPVTPRDLVFDCLRAFE